MLIALVLTSVASQPAAAWGRQGHAAVAALAQANLTPAAQAQVTQLLMGDLDRDGKPSGRTTLAAVASWPDEIRDIAPKGAYAGWHVRANRVCSSDLGPCKDGHCVDQNIIHFTQVLADPAQPQQARNEALKWVVHLVGDLHQPLHSGVGLDKGQVRVELDGIKSPSVTLHEAWDTQLAKAALAKGPLTGTLTERQPLAANAPTAWMRESRDIALETAYAPLPGFTCDTRLTGTVRLDRAYQAQALPMIRQEMQKAGLRLAQLLNTALH
ncbi:MAG: S1/P1 nuclease [Rhodocyclaceae bacterium]